MECDSHVYCLFIVYLSADQGCLGLSIVLHVCTRTRQDFRAGLGPFCSAANSGLPCFSGQLWLGRAQGSRHGLVRAARAGSSAVSRIVHMHACVHGYMSCTCICTCTCMAVVIDRSCAGVSVVRGRAHFRRQWCRCSWRSHHSCYSML